MFEGYSLLNRAIKGSLNGNLYKCGRCNYPLFVSDAKCPNCGCPADWERLEQIETLQHSVWTPSLWYVFGSLWKKYAVVYADIDGKEVTRARVVNVVSMFHGQKRVTVHKTRKGYHVRVYLEEPARGFRVLLFLLELGTDPQYIRRWLERRAFALFRVRRGVENEKHLYTVDPDKH